MPRGRKPKEEVQSLTGSLNERNLVQKSKPLFSLWNSDLTLAEFKILDTYLSRIDSRKPSKRNVKFAKGELESLLNVKKLNQKVLDERLKHLMGYVVRVDNPNKRKGYALISLFEKAYCEKDEYGLWEVELECTNSAMEYFFNIEELGYLRYKIRSITQIKSVYSYIMFTYLEYNRWRKSWIISIEDLKDLLNCREESYSEYKIFNNRILKRCYSELTEKTDLRYTYETVGKDGKPVKRGCKAYGIKFTLETLSDKIQAEQQEQAKLEVLDGQLDIDDFLDEETGERLRKPIYQNDKLEFLAGACDNEFNNEQMQVIFSIITTKDLKPTDEDYSAGRNSSLDFARYHYLMEKYAVLNHYTTKSGIKSVNRFNYFCKMLKNDQAYEE